MDHLTADDNRQQQAWSCRLITLTSYFTAVILLGAYSATLTSFLAIRRHELPFTDFQSLVNDGTYRVIVASGSAHLNYFNSSRNLVLKQLYKQLIEPHVNDLPRSLDEGLERMCQHTKMAYVASDIFMRAARLSVETKVSVTLSVVKKFHSSGVYFVHAGKQGSLELLKFVMSIAREGVPASAVFVQTLCAEVRVQSNPLYVMSYSNTSSDNPLTQLSARRLRRAGKWLVFLDTLVSLEELFDKTYIPLDTEFMVAQSSTRSTDGVLHVSLTELYHIHYALPLQMFFIGNWSSVSGLTWSSAPLSQRRRDLHGIVIKGALRPQAPYITERKYKNKKPIEFGGFTMRIFREFESRMNFTPEYFIPRDGAYGFRNANGTWTGIVGMVATDEVEIGIGLFSFTEGRMDVIDYLPPILNPKLTAYIRQPSDEYTMWSHILSPFGVPLWRALVTVMLTLMVALTATWYFGAERDKTDYSFKTSFFLVLGAFSQQSHAIAPKTLSSRLVYLMVYVTAVIMTTSYAATFISFLAVRRYKLPFEDFEGLLKDGSYRLGLNRATGHLHLFQDSDDPLMRQIYTDLIEPEVRSNALPQTDLEGLRKLCDESKYSFLTLDTSLKGLEKEIPCNIVAIPRAFHTTTLSMLISKSSSYRTLFTDQ
ncbi:hypothetical protein B7P43_G10051 [Cryptotermes secundus]|uniref:Ionotropic glutamate receptor L-glutamate and glycine-binding domain-containing protein n=1 Tax=Cryptotermes secundus TaxID=105785 RepID=A0A2J7Q5U4_9NEOP|nr:hypothetical protein B7P43_G10051 [Cryptotermes secundus]